MAPVLEMQVARIGEGKPIAALPMGAPKPLLSPSKRNCLLLPAPVKRRRAPAPWDPGQEGITPRLTTPFPSLTWAADTRLGLSS